MNHKLSYMHLNPYSLAGFDTEEQMQDRTPVPREARPAFGFRAGATQVQPA